MIYPMLELSPDPQPKDNVRQATPLQGFVIYTTAGRQTDCSFHQLSFHFIAVSGNFHGTQNEPTREEVKHSIGS